MKRAKFLFDKIVDYENIRLAWLKARKGKIKKAVVQKIALNVNENLLKVQKKSKIQPDYFKPVCTVLKSMIQKSA